MNGDSVSETVGKGLHIERRFTKPGKNPLEEVTYERRSSAITEPDGSIVFELKDLEVPSTWSQLATDIIASKYMRKAGVPKTGHETSVRQVVFRIAHTIRVVGEQLEYFSTQEDADAFENELSYMLVNQVGAFNSPVWFNCGLYQQYGIKGSGGNYAWDFDKNNIEMVNDSYSRPQCSACFIQSVDDDLMSIFELSKNEAKLFKYGSGTGTNFSGIRGRQEKLSSGGSSSGLMSFLEVLDKGAGATKSGGTTRRAAKMVCLDMDHPEIADFITWKAKEEKKAKILIANGYPSDFNGEAYHTVSGQNSNNSVRIPDRFMEAALQGGTWQTTMRTTGEIFETFDAKELMGKISQAAWECADPGVQFDDTINKWHTCKVSGRINASNPCSEYMFLDDTACNLASVNLMKFLEPDNTFDIEGFRHACRVFIVAQEILVDFASYPTERIARNSHIYRTLGLGYANLGTMLMVSGLPYDSDDGRALASGITAIMTGEAYLTSSVIAQAKGTFAGYAKNAEPMLDVISMHLEEANKIPELCPSSVRDAAIQVWEAALESGKEHGYRNAQVTVLAPTGTIGLLMDCDTTGVEPDFAVVKWKKLAGGGYFKIINQSLPAALRTLGYDNDQVDDIIRYVIGAGTLEGAPHVNPLALRKHGLSSQQIADIEAKIAKNKILDEYTPHIADLKLTPEQMAEAKLYVSGTGTVEGAPHLSAEHYPVFDCANKCGTGKRFIAAMGHV
ncbi:ribonucleoside-diphosphate reductase, adenosylcobalamin-dependent, partial [Candidatus Woesearchaeota archaeon CG_4_10_14_0_2_um_filter_57_5]